VFPAIGKKIMMLNAHRVIQKAHREQLILLAIEDITERTLNYLKEKEITELALNRNIMNGFSRCFNAFIVRKNIMEPVWVWRFVSGLSRTMGV
jgi:hypothetical protein